MSLLLTSLLAGMGPVLFPPSGLPASLVTLGQLSPATYAASALRQTLIGPLQSRLMLISLHCQYLLETALQSDHEIQRNRRGAITRAMVGRFVRSVWAVERARAIHFSRLWIVASRGIRPDATAWADEVAILRSGRRQLEALVRGFDERARDVSSRLRLQNLVGR